MAAGSTSYFEHKEAAVPTACPIQPQVAITLVDPKATWVALILRPANKRLGIFREYKLRKGILYNPGTKFQAVASTIVDALISM